MPPRTNARKRKAIAAILAKRRKVIPVRRYGLFKRFYGTRRRLTYGKRNRYRRRRRVRATKSATLTLKSYPQDVWFDNTSTTDVIGCKIQPKFTTGSTDGYVKLSNSTIPGEYTEAKINMMKPIEFDKYASLYNYYKVKRIWFKYVPAIKNLNVQYDSTLSTPTGIMNYYVSRNTNTDLITPNTYDGQAMLRTHTRCRSKNFVLPHFGSYVPSRQITYDVVEPGDRNITEYSPGFKTSESFNLNGNYLYMFMEVPKLCGIQQSEFNPDEGTNWPAELQSVCVGSFVMGCDLTFYGKKGYQ